MAHYAGPAKELPGLFLSYFKTLSIGTDQGIELLIYSLHSSSLPTKVD